jgi:hypothetical protein
VLRARGVDDDGWKGVRWLARYYSSLTRMRCDLRTKCGYGFSIGEDRYF